MAYGILKCDTITFTDAGVDKSVTISGLVQNPTFTGNVTATGTISGDIVRGQTISGVTVTGTTAQFTSGTFVSLTGTTTSGTTANFVSGVFTTQISGATVTGGNANFTSGTFTNISGGVYTITSGVFALGTSGTPSISFASDPNTGIYSPGADQVAISTNGTGRLFVDASGNVGVGVTPSAWNSSTKSLEINTVGAVIGDAFTTKLATNCFYNASGNWIYRTSAGASRYEVERGAHTWYNAASGTAGNTITFTQAMTLDSSGRLGLGTSSPAQLLETQDGNIQIRNSLTLSVNTLSPYGLTFRNANQLGQDRGTIAEIKPYLAGAGDNDFGLQFRTQATTAGGVTTKMTLTPGGSLGIGATTVNTTLEVLNSSTPIIRVGDGTRHVQLWGGSSTQNQAVGTATSAAFNININSSPVATFDTSGRLLVGTSSDLSGGVANTSFQLAASSGSGVSTLAQIYSFNSGGGVAALDLCRSKSTTLGTNTTVANNDYIGSLNFKGANGSSYLAAASVSCEIDGAVSGGGAADMPGRLVFSTTADGASSPTERMRIQNDGNIYTYTTGTASLVAGTSSSAGTTNTVFIGVYNRTGTTTSGSEGIRIYSNGNIQNINNSYGTLSDVKLKQNIVDASSQWDDLKAVRVRNFNFIEGQTHRQIGVVAQELEQVSPGLVYETPDRDAEGNDLGTVTKGVSYSVLYMKAVKALQEAMERIETLEAKVAALEAA